MASEVSATATWVQVPVNLPNRRRTKPFHSQSTKGDYSLRLRPALFCLSRGVIFTVFVFFNFTTLWWKFGQIIFFIEVASLPIFFSMHYKRSKAGLDSTEWYMSRELNILEALKIFVQTYGHYSYSFYWVLLLAVPHEYTTWNGTNKQTRSVFWQHLFWFIPWCLWLRSIIRWHNQKTIKPFGNKPRLTFKLLPMSGKPTASLQLFSIFSELYFRIGCLNSQLLC